jgi:Ricin-type beta-trefoil lectin domain/Lysozyme like domain
MRQLPRFRVQLSLSWFVKLVIPLAAVGVAIAVPAEASSNGSAASGPARADPVQQSAIISPLLGIAPKTAAQAATASSTCVRYATRAGWPNNGYFAGDLVTAAAICVAESAGDPHRIVCDKDGKVDGTGDFPGFTCPPDATSYDRGLWQLNTAVPGAVSDACAFNPVCNAKAAYLASGRGTSFAPWSSYDQDIYSKFIDPAQTAVTHLSAGTVTSALLGECLVRAKQAISGKVVIANCGPGTASQQWSISGGKLRSGSLCAAISSTSAASPRVVLRRCASQKIQQWSVAGRDELRNKADGKCLTDPGSSLKAGTQVTATRCVNAKNQTWWLP